MGKQLENRFYKVKIDLTDEYRKRFNIPDDYEQYYFINFVTQEGYCYLPDGVKATHYNYNKYTDITDPVENKRKTQFAILSIAVTSKYEKYFKAGHKYADKHNIQPAQWVQRVNKETEENIRQHELEDEEKQNANTNDYIILPTPVDSTFAKILQMICKHSFTFDENKIENREHKMRWLMIDEGYTHDNMFTEHKNTWVYYHDENYSDDYDEEDEKNYKPLKLADITPLAMVTIGYLNEKLLITVRFIMVDNEMSEPNDVHMELPFKEPFNENNLNIHEIITVVKEKLPNFITLIDKTVNKN